MIADASCRLVAGELISSANIFQKKCRSADFLNKIVGELINSADLKKRSVSRFFCQLKKLLLS